MWFRDDWLNAFYLVLQRHASQLRLCKACSSAIHINDENNDSGEQIDVAQSDYRFTYVGLQGSRTLLHADVLRSNSWSANVAGTKRCADLAMSSTAQGGFCCLMFVQQHHPFDLFANSELPCQASVGRLCLAMSRYGNVITINQ